MNKTWYAVMMDEDDFDFDIGSFKKEEAIEKVKKMFPTKGWIAVIKIEYEEKTGKEKDKIMIDIIKHENIFKK